MKRCLANWQTARAERAATVLEEEVGQPRRARERAETTPRSAQNSRAFAARITLQRALVAPPRNTGVAILHFRDRTSNPVHLTRETRRRTTRASHEPDSRAAVAAKPGCAPPGDVSHRRVAAWGRSGSRQEEGGLVSVRGGPAGAAARARVEAKRRGVLEVGGRRIGAGRKRVRRRYCQHAGAPYSGSRCRAARPSTARRECWLRFDVLVLLSGCPRARRATRQ